MGEIAAVPVKLPGVDVAVYPVIGDPPSEAGAVNDTVACPLPAVAVPMVGAPGTEAYVAVTVREAVIEVMVQTGPLTESQPVKPVNTEFAPAAAVSWMERPAT